MRSHPRLPLILLAVFAVAGAAKTAIQVAAVLNPPPSVTEVLAAGEIQVNGSTLGDPAAPVTIVEFVDLRCGPAAELHRTYLPHVIDELVRTGRAKISLVAIAHLGRRSVIGQEVFDRVAPKGQSWAFTDAVFATERGPENSREMDWAYLKPILQNLPGVVPADLAGDGAKIDRVQRRHERLAQQLGATGTPWFAIGPSSERPSTYRPISAAGAIPTPSEIAEAVEALEPSA